MIDNITKDYISAVLDLYHGVEKADMEMARNACGILNELDLDLDVQGQVNEIVHEFCFVPETDPATLEYVINSLNCIFSKKYLHSLLEILRLNREVDTEGQRKWMEEFDVSSIDLSTKISQSFYIKLLLQMCFAYKLFDKAEEIRALVNKEE